MNKEIAKKLLEISNDDANRFLGWCCQALSTEPDISIRQLATEFCNTFGGESKVRYFDGPEFIRKVDGRVTYARSKNGGGWFVDSEVHTLKYLIDSGHKEITAEQGEP